MILVDTGNSEHDRHDDSTAWTLSTTSMTEAEATRAAATIRSMFPDVYADPVDPRFSMTLHLDRWTTQLVRDGVARLTAEGRDCGNMLEAFDEWLAHADPTPDSD